MLPRYTSVCGDRTALREAAAPAQDRHRAAANPLSLTSKLNLKITEENTLIH